MGRVFLFVYSLFLYHSGGWSEHKSLINDDICKHDHFVNIVILDCKLEIYEIHDDWEITTWGVGWTTGALQATSSPHSCFCVVNVHCSNQIFVLALYFIRFISRLFVSGGGQSVLVVCHGRSLSDYSMAISQNCDVVSSFLGEKPTLLKNHRRYLT